MTKETIEKLLQHLSKIQIFNSFFTIQGSFVLYLSKSLKRLPNDLDILILKRKNFNDNTNDFLWKRLLENFQHKIVVDSIRFKKALINFNNENFHLELIVSKNVDEKYVETNRCVNVTKTDYSFFAKISQLFYLLSDNYRNKDIFDPNKIKRTINDLMEIYINTPDLLKYSNMNFLRECVSLDLRFWFYAFDESYLKNYKNLINIIQKRKVSLLKQEKEFLVKIVEFLNNEEFNKFVDISDFIIRNKWKLFEIFDKYWKEIGLVKADKTLFYLKKPNILLNKIFELFISLSKPLPRDFQKYYYKINQDIHYFSFSFIDLLEIIFDSLVKD